MGRSTKTSLITATFQIITALIIKVKRATKRAMFQVLIIYNKHRSQRFKKIILSQKQNKSQFVWWITSFWRRVTKVKANRNNKCNNRNSIVLVNKLPNSNCCSNNYSFNQTIYSITKMNLEFQRRTLCSTT